MSANAQELLPLSLGNKWTLASPYVDDPVTLEVTSDGTFGEKRRVRVRFTNPWTTYDFILNPVGGEVMLEGLGLGGESYYLNEPAILFPSGGSVGSVRNTTAGSVTLVSTQATVEGALQTYANVRHYRLNLFGGGLDWYLAPGVGFVQFGEGPAAFVLDAVHFNPYVPPTEEPHTTGPCPRIGVDSNPAPTSSFSESEQEEALLEVTAAGANFTHVSVRWGDIEPAPQVYDFSNIARWMGWASEYSLDVALTVRGIDTTTVSMPPDLVGRSVDDPAVIDRFVAMMTAMSGTLNSRVKWINVGNEADVYLKDLPSAAPAVQQFLESVVARLSPTFGDRSFGMVFTHAARANPEMIAPLIAASQHVAFTYYPLNADMSVRNPSAVSAEIAEVVALAGLKPLLLTEVGFPTSPLLGSSESMQASFVTNFLDALSRSSGKIVAANLFQRNEMPAEIVSYLVDYYNSGGLMTAETAARVGAFIGTLGFHTQSGSMKQAWSVLLNRGPRLAGPNACTTN